MSESKKTLLIVDDEEDIRDILSVSFERRGYKIVTASNGKEAYEIFLKGGIDLVISDIQMPGGNGVELLDKIRGHHHEMPVVLFITGFSEITLEEAYDKGAEALFAKPFDNKQLAAVVERALTPKDLRWKPRHPRIPSDLAVELKFSGLSETRKAQLLNIGRGGLFVGLTSDFPKINDKVSFKIQISDEMISLIEGSGVVRWVRQESVEGMLPGCGVEFMELADSTRLKVIELINYLKTKQYIPRRGA